MGRGLPQIWVVVVVAVGVALGLVGCAGPPKAEVPEEPACELTLEEVIAGLEARRAAMVPLRAGGQCRIAWWDEDGQRHEESCSIQLRVCPPRRVFLVGSGLLGEMIRLGADETDFYLRIKPKEVSAYWGGRRERLAGCGQRLWLDPDNLLEALGQVTVDRSWVLLPEGGQVVLVRVGADGRLVKQIAVECGTGRVRRIDYHASDGAFAATVEMGDYKAIKAGDEADGGVLEVPTELRMTAHGARGKRAEVALELSGVRRFEPTEAQMEKLFRRADAAGMEHVYELDEGCRFVEVEAQED